MLKINRALSSRHITELALRIHLAGDRLRIDNIAPMITLVAGLLDEPIRDLANRG